MKDQELNIQSLREIYLRGELNRDDLDQDPMVLFKTWFQQAKDAKIKEPNAMTLSTVNSDQKPSSRIVLLKELEATGFIFYTNYSSRKAQDINDNSSVSLVFLWKELERQVRIEGTVSKVDRARSTKYFQGRPKGSQIGAWVSNQSGVIQGREELESKKKELEIQYADAEFLPCPEDWGGYFIDPTNIEFWQGRPSRLHDRFRYSKNQDSWSIDRLAP